MCNKEVLESCLEGRDWVKSGLCKLWARAIMLSNFLIMLSRWKIYSDLLKIFLLVWDLRLNRLREEYLPVIW